MWGWALPPQHHLLPVVVVVLLACCLLAWPLLSALHLQGVCHFGCWCGACLQSARALMAACCHVCLRMTLLTLPCSCMLLLQGLQGARVAVVLAVWALQAAGAGVLEWGVLVCVRLPGGVASVSVRHLCSQLHCRAVWLFVRCWSGLAVSWPR